MMLPDEYTELKRTLVELDPDELLDTLRIDSVLLLEIVENYDPMLIEDAGERVGGSSRDDRDDTYTRAAGKKERGPMKQ